MPIITNLSYHEALALPDPKNIWLDGDRVIVDTSPGKQVPQSISAYQARIALSEAGLLATVENAVNTQGGDMKIRWDWAGELHRNHPDVLAIAGALGWSADQLDDLFITAQKK